MQQSSSNNRAAPTGGRTGAFNRRRLLGGGATLAAGTAGLALVGCGDDDEQPSATSPTTAATGASSVPATATAQATPAVEKPVPGGTLRMGRLTDIVLNTGWPSVVNGANLPITYMITEPLVRYRDSLTPENVVAERMEYNSDRSKVTITLRQGVAFHNGAKVTPDDVFFGIDLMLNPGKYGVTGAFQLAPFAKFITDRKKIDERTMEFTFDRPRVNMSDFFAQMQITHAASYEDLKTGKSVQGTGPYVFKNWVPKESFRVEKNPNWHGTAKDGGPYLDAIESRVFADESALAQAFAGGSIDMAQGVTGATAKPFRDKKQTRVSPKSGLVYVGLVVTNPVLQDPRVRQAIFLAVDRKRIAEEIGQSFNPVTSQVWPAKSPAFDKSLETPSYDVAKAKDLLKQAAFAQSKPLQLPFSAALYGAHAAVFKENLEAIGVKVDLVPTDNTAFLNDFNARKFTDLFISASAFSDLSPITMLQQAFPYRIPNLSYFGEPGGTIGQDYATLVKELESYDPLSDKAKEAYGRFTKFWLNDPWIAPLIGNDRIELVGENVRGADEYFLTVQQQLNFGKVWKKA